MRTILYKADHKSATLNSIETYCNVLALIFSFQVRFCEIELGIPADRASLLYTYMAIAAFFSNHFFCKLSEIKLKYVDIFDLYQLATTCFGICLLLLPLARSYKVMVALSVLFGLMDGGRYGLMPLVVLECVGQKRTDQAWGYLSFGVGFASAIGPTFIGKLQFTISSAMHLLATSLANVTTEVRS